MARRPIRTATNRLVRFVKLRILYTDDSPHRIALGVAIGLFVAWTPLPGALMLTTLGLTCLLKANKLAGLAVVWVNNPLTIIAIYYCGYLLGGEIFALFGPNTQAELVQAGDLFNEIRSIGDIINGIFHPEFWHQLRVWMLEVGAKLWVGCLSAGMLTALSGYLVTFQIVRLYRDKGPYRETTEGP